MRELVGQALRFGTVGVVNTAIGLMVIFGSIYFFDADPALANAIGYAVGFTLGFLLNRLWTFADTQAIADVLPSYLLAAAISYLLNLTVVVVGTRWFGAQPYLIQLFGVGVYTMTMFLACRWFVFQSPAPPSGSSLSPTPDSP